MQLFCLIFTEILLILLSAPTDAEFDGENWKEKKSWRMYYEGVSTVDQKHRIMVATSRDGKTWEKQGLAFDVGSPGSWDSEGVGSPHVIRMDDGTERMYYTGQGEGGSTAIGVAKLAQSQEWIREQATVTFV